MDETDLDESVLDERSLVELARHDKEAFGKLYELYFDKIYNYVYYRTGNSHDAQDLTARVFFRAIQHIADYQDYGAPISAWFYRIARNLLANWYRDEGKRQMVSLDFIAELPAGGSPELATEILEDREALLAAIRRQPADRQELLILKFLERLPNAEIGQIMGRTEGAVKSLYHRTMLSLRDDLRATSWRQQTARRRSAKTGENAMSWPALQGRSTEEEVDP